MFVINKKILVSIIVGVIALLLIASGVLFFWLPYSKAKTEPLQGTMEVKTVDDGTVMLSWPVSERASRYLVKVTSADGSETYLEEYYSENICQLPELSENKEISVSVAPAVPYRMLWMDKERLSEEPLSATAQWTFPILEEVKWEVNPDTKAAKLSYHKATQDRCKLFILQEDGTWLQLMDSQEQSMLVQFGNYGVYPVPVKDEIFQFRAYTYHQEGNLVFCNESPASFSASRDDFLGRELNPQLKDEGYNVCTITWEETKGETYQVQRKGTKADEWITLVEIPYDGERSYTSGHMAVNKTFTYRVVAVGGQVMEGSEFAAVSQPMDQVTKESPIFCTIWATKELPVYKNADKTEELGKIKANSTWCVTDEVEGMFAIRYNGEVGYIDSNCCLINLPEYMADMCSYNITNSYASIYLMHEFEIPEVTNVVTGGYEKVQLDEGEYLVPLLYPTAKRLADAARIAKEKGYRLKIYDAFRPEKATKEIYERTNKILDNPIPEMPFKEDVLIEDLNLPEQKTQIDPVTGLEVPIPLTYREVMIVPPYSLTYFVSKGPSKHNFGVALDLTLEKISNGKEVEMQTAIHDLSHYSALDYNNSNAKTLSSIMKKAGFTTLVSEWWHFNDLKSKEDYKAVAVWSGVSAKCWMADDNGWRYRKDDGKYYKNKEVKIDGVTYSFDEDGYVINP